MFASSMKTLISPSITPFSLHLPKPSLFSKLLLPFSLTATSSFSSLTKSKIDSRRKLQTKSSSSPPSHPLSFTPPGEIHVIVGPMFSGKTTTLLRRILAERDLGKKIAVIKSNKDTRYSVSSIVTHDGEKFPCWSLPDLSSFKSRFGIEAYKNQLDVIGIDEAQFFGDLYEFCREAADVEGKIVIVAGLDGDYLRRKFGCVLDVVPIADTVTKLSSRCEVCGKKGLFTMRKTEEKVTELIGGSEVYMPVCRNHYVSAVLDSASRKTQTQTHDVASL